MYDNRGLHLLIAATMGLTVADACWLRAVELIGVRGVVLWDGIQPLVAAVLGTIVRVSKLI